MVVYNLTRLSLKSCHRRVAEHELNRASQQQQLRRWRAVFHSLSEESSSEMPRRTVVPGTSYSALNLLQRYKEILRPPRIRGKKERWKPPPFLMMRNINMPSFPSLMLQRYEENLKLPKKRGIKKSCHHWSRRTRT